MKLQTVPKLVAIYLFTVYTIAMVGALMLAYCPFRIQHEGYVYIVGERYPNIGKSNKEKHEEEVTLATGGSVRTWTRWSEIDINSAWYKFGMWAMLPPGCLLVALPITLLSYKEVKK